MKSNRCQVCKEILFVGPSDPFDQYVDTGMGWGGVPLAVCRGSWRNLWRRKWYHQTCCGVYIDRTDLAGRWHVFGFQGRDFLEAWKAACIASTDP